MRLDASTPGDVPDIQAMLQAAGLPLLGVAEAFRAGVVAHDADSLVGAAAIEPYGSVGLLRSVVVRPERQGTGIGKALMAALETRALDLGVIELFLLTETAEGWFSRQGYSPVERASMPPEWLLASDENTVACSMSAVAMRRTLGAPRR